MSAPGLVLVTGGEGPTALDRLAAVSRWVDGIICARIERSQRSQAAERARERRARQRRRQRADRRRQQVSVLVRSWRR